MNKKDNLASTKKDRMDNDQDGNEKDKIKY